MRKFFAAALLLSTCTAVQAGSGTVGPDKKVAALQSQYGTARFACKESRNPADAEQGCLALKLYSIRLAALGWCMGPLDEPEVTKHWTRDCAEHPVSSSAEASAREAVGSLHALGPPSGHVDVHVVQPGEGFNRAPQVWPAPGTQKPPYEKAPPDAS